MTDWTQAACIPIVTSPATDLWHPLEGGGGDPGERRAKRDQRARDAKAVCAGCPVKAACLASATEDDYGIRGGLTADERAGSRICADARGTTKGYQRHRRARDAVCDPCRTAWNGYQAEIKRRDRAA